MQVFAEVPHWYKWCIELHTCSENFTSFNLKFVTSLLKQGFPDHSVGKESTCNVGDPFYSWVGKIHWGRDMLPTTVFLGFPCGSAGKESTCIVGDLDLIPGLGRFPWRRESWPTPGFWTGEFHGLYSLWGCKESDTTEQLSLSLY